MAFGVNHALRVRAVVILKNDFFHAGHAAGGVAAGFNGATNIVHKPIPLAVETATTSARGLGHPVVVVKVLGDRNFAWKLRVNLIIAPLQQTPSFWNIHAILVGAAHVFGAVPAQAIHAEFIQPHHGIIANVLAHFGARIIHTRIAPRCFGARGVVVKINSA